MKIITEVFYFKDVSTILKLCLTRQGHSHFSLTLEYLRVIDAHPPHGDRLLLLHVRITFILLSLTKKITRLRDCSFHNILSQYLNQI